MCSSDSWLAGVFRTQILARFAAFAMNLAHLGEARRTGARIHGMVFASSALGGSMKSVATPPFIRERTMENLALWPPAKARRRESQPDGNGDAMVAGNDRDAAAIVTALNKALAIARSVALRCERQYLSALRSHFPPLAAVSLCHAYEARAHAHAISAYIGELGGNPNTLLEWSVPSVQSDLLDGNSRVAAISEVRADACAAIEGYRQIVASLVRFDPTTKDLVELILASEQKRASVLGSLLNGVSTHRKR
jgi:hypothetical protein